jgi:hypothetical protein
MTNPNQPVCSYAATEQRNGRASGKTAFPVCRIAVRRTKFAVRRPLARPSLLFFVQSRQTATVRG